MPIAFYLIGANQRNENIMKVFFSWRFHRVMAPWRWLHMAVEVKMNADVQEKLSQYLKSCH
jgi:hypothetical protein